jgi:hypothetical protein
MSNCLIPVDQTYVNKLISLLIRHHAYLAKFKMMDEVVGINKSNISFKHLPVISNVIFFLLNWSSDIDCNEVHKAKFFAMSLIGFGEQDIDDEEVNNAIILEWGYIYLQEIGNIYISQE